MLLMMAVIPLAGVVLVGLWVAWWISADYMSVDRSTPLKYVAPASERRGMPVLTTGQNTRLAR